MRWRGRRQSENIEDRRGMPVRGAAIGGVGTLIIIVLGLLLGVNPMALLQQMPQQGPPAPGAGAPAGPNQIDDEVEEFVSVVLADTEEVWTELFRRDLNRRYQEPTLVLFSGRVESACGLASAAVGPFYCPADQQVYLDTSFFQQLDDQLGAPGDFAQAYVIAHEVGHHVQNLLGISDEVRRAQQAAGSEAEANEYSVRLELQADYLAGVWAHYADQNWGILEPGDVEEALTAASAIGDDTLQREATGTVRPDSFTHGTSAQRVRWFTRGLETGVVDMNNTFEADRL